MRRKKTGQIALAMAAALALAACGHGQDTKEEGAAAEETGETESRPEEPESPAEEEAEVPDTQTEAGEDTWKQRFGESCIPDQCFEVELSEYDGSVLFVPFAPSEDTPEFHIQLFQGEEVLTELTGYVPESLAGEPFQSLDAVSFFDVNYDGCTDILLIETYGDTCFAAVYYGFDDDAGVFWPQEQLSDQLTEQAETLTVPAIRDLLSGGKKNGAFESCQEAYKAVSRLCELESEEALTYDLIYVDEDEIPELTSGKNGYYTSLYTYGNGTVYTLMDRWPYGAMGNAGYEYAPKKNSLRNDNTDYAGAILYTTYMEIGSSHTLDTVAEIKLVNFDDVNGNGVPDEEEMGSVGSYGVCYLDGKEASDEECAAFDAGGYEPIMGSMSREELLEKL